MNFQIICLQDRPALIPAAARWFHEKWEIPEEAYAQSMGQSIAQAGPVPRWYLALDGETIAAGMGVIENDFHDRPDLAPNVCAVYTEPEYRCQGLAGQLLRRVCGDMLALGIPRLYLVTDLVGFYERYDWEYLCQAQCDGEPIRVYTHWESPVLP